jgi:molecular chaperone HscA
VVEELLAKARLGADPNLKQRVSAGVFRAGARHLKEVLFLTGELTHQLLNDQTVSLRLDEFLSTEGVRLFTSTIEAEWQRFLNLVDETWANPLNSAKLVITGGGCDLPMIKTLANKTWQFRGHSIRFQPTPVVPDFIVEHFAADFAREYPQLAVALGGALPSVLDERSSLEKWHGGAATPGPLTRYAITGA